MLETVLCNPLLDSCNSWTTMETWVFSVWSVPRSYKKIWVGELLVETRVEAGSNTSTVTLRVVGGDENGSLKTETVKYGREIQGTRTRERLRWRGPSAYTKDTRPLVREGAPQKQDRNCQWSSTPRRTDWPTVSRNVTLTLLADSWVLQGRLRRDGAIVQLTLHVWSVNQRATAWPEKLKSFHC
jgi:hypothetical protein